eukprot:COSAG02_NODE_54298_length_297_cov_0.313131_1_plen_31_part_10
MAILTQSYLTKRSFVSAKTGGNWSGGNRMAR